MAQILYLNYQGSPIHQSLYNTYPDTFSYIFDSGDAVHFRITSMLKATRYFYGAVAVEVVLLRTLALRTPACTDPPATGRLNLFAPTLKGESEGTFSFKKEVTDDLREL